MALNPRKPPVPRQRQIILAVCERTASGNGYSNHTLATMVREAMPDVTNHDVANALQRMRDEELVTEGSPRDGLWYRTSKRPAT